MTNSSENTAGPPRGDEMLVVVAKLGEALDRSSYPVTVIKEILEDITDAYKYDIEAEIFANYLIALDRGNGRVEVSSAGPSYRFDQVDRTEALVRELRAGAIKLDDAATTLDNIANARPPLTIPVRVIGYVFMAMGFAMCFRMSPMATAAAMVIAIPVALIMLSKIGTGRIGPLMPFLLTFLTALALAFWAKHTGTADPVRLAVIPVLTLVPGAAISTSLMELTEGDMTAGASRLIYALVVMLSMAFGLALAIEIAGVPAENLEDLTSNLAPSWVIWLSGPLFGLGAALYFCTPRKVWFWTIFACFGTLMLSQLLDKGVASPYAGGIAMGVNVLFAYFINVRVRSRPSMLMMYLPTFWLMVPGSMGFVAFSGVMTGAQDLSDMTSSAAMALLSMSICMMVGLVLAPYLAHPVKKLGLDTRSKSKDREPSTPTQGRSRRIRDETPEPGK